jgi:hypothetical protein
VLQSPILVGERGISKYEIKMVLESHKHTISSSPTEPVDKILSRDKRHWWSVHLALKSDLAK